jgi:ATP-dependent exoDNAse (exonuclease V) alpha subunit
VAVNRAELWAHWQGTAEAVGFNHAQQQALADRAIARAAEPDHALRHEAVGDLAAPRAVSQAIEKLSERQSVFAKSTLEAEAGKLALGRSRSAQIAAAIDAARAEVLIEKPFVDKRGFTYEGFTTHEMIGIERAMLAHEAAGRGTAAPLLVRSEAALTVARASAESELEGRSWTQDQTRATIGVLSSRNRIMAVQGFAGTAKTTTVLATVAAQARRQGLDVKALAPTAAAAMTLGSAIDQPGVTVARHLIDQQRLDGPPQRAALWIVDEASLLSARAMERVMTAANAAQARVLLVGDAKQLGSVEAGAAFGQLQSAGMETFKLAEIVRQTNPLTREAVEAALDGDAKRALAALDRGGGRVVEVPDTATRMEALAKAYRELSPAERRQTIVIDPTRAGRDALTEAIRQQLANAGALSDHRLMVSALDAKGLTRAEAKDAASYTKGDVILFGRDYTDKGVTAGRAYTVERMDPERNAVMLKGPVGEAVDWRPRQWGASATAYDPRTMELRIGDAVMATRNDGPLGRTNGLRGEITGLNPEDQTARVRWANGRSQTLDLTAPRDQHVRHGYVETAHAAQGRTADRVLIHAESRQTNLLDQRLLYVALSRAKSEAVIFTDDRAKLLKTLQERAGERQTALEMPNRALESKAPTLQASI